MFKCARLVFEHSSSACLLEDPGPNISSPGASVSSSRNWPLRDMVKIQGCLWKRVAWSIRGWSRDMSRLLKAGLWGTVQSTEGVTSFLVLQ